MNILERIPFEVDINNMPSNGTIAQVEADFAKDGEAPLTDEEKMALIGEEKLCFHAKDPAVLEMLWAYKEDCKRRGATDQQLQSVAALIDQVTQWRAVNLD